MIPRILFVIWIGDESKRPDHWIDTWKSKHPDWEHRIYGNETLYGRTWKNQELIDCYISSNDWPGVHDIMRYELLEEHGGFCHPADSECLYNVEELLDDHTAYGVYENEIARPGLVSPLYACVPGHPFVKLLNNNLPKHPGLNRKGDFLPPWKVTGNLYMKKMIEKYPDPTLKLWPSYRFIPIHFTGETYKGDEKVYAVAKFGSTPNSQNLTYKWSTS